MRKKKIVIGNLKMNLETVSMRKQYLKDSENAFKEMSGNTDVVLCPQNLYLESFVNFFKEKNVFIGAQDCFWETYGAHTGEISPKTIKSLGAEYVIIGHSERRALGETDEEVSKKCSTALRVGLTPVVCVGYIGQKKDETVAIGESIESILKNISQEDLKKIIFAYEPVWAIGSGKTPSADDIHTVVLYIKKIIGKKFSPEIIDDVNILYGGSVSPENISNIIIHGHVEGVLIGGVSLQVERFAKTVKIINNLLKK